MNASSDIGDIETRPAPEFAWPLWTRGRRGSRTRDWTRRRGMRDGVEGNGDRPGRPVIMGHETPSADKQAVAIAHPNVVHGPCSGVLDGGNAHHTTQSPDR